MTDETGRRVVDTVAATGMAHEVIHIDPALADTADFCAHYGYPLETSGNCILVASREDRPRMAACVALATTKLDVNKRVRKLLGVRKLSFAPADLTRDVTGMEIGGVTPFNLPTHQPYWPDERLPLWIDARVQALQRVIVGGGSREIKLAVAPAALTAIGGEFVNDLATDL